MPRKIRKRSAAPLMNIPKSSNKSRRHTPSWRLHETLRFWCPCCGMVADASRLANAPYIVKTAIQYYGGKQEDGRGYIEYEPEGGSIDGPEIEDILHDLIPALEGALEYVFGELGMDKPVHGNAIEAHQTEDEELEDEEELSDPPKQFIKQAKRREQPHIKRPMRKPTQIKKTQFEESKRLPKPKGVQ